MPLKDLTDKFQADVEAEVQRQTSQFDALKGVLRVFPLGQVRNAKRILVLMEPENGPWRIEDFTDALKRAREVVE